MDLTVRSVAGDELQAIFRLRYEVFRGELGALVVSDAIEKGALEDDYDSIGINYGLFKSGNLAGSVRVVDFAKCLDSPLFQRYPLGPILDRYGIGAVCQLGRMAVRRDLRASIATVTLVKAVVAETRARQVRVAISDCSPYLLPLYNILGYRRIGEPFNDSIYGLKYPIAFILDDLAFMRAQKSPVIKTVEGLPEDPDATTWYDETYPKYVETSTRVSASPEALANLLGHYLGTAGVEQPSLFRGLDPSEMKALLRGGAAFDVKKGDLILRAGLKEENLVVLLSGSVDVLEPDGRVRATAGAGEFVGEMALLTGFPRSADVIARESCQCLLINAHTLAGLEEREPRLAAKLMRNLARALVERLQIESGLKRV